MSEVMRWKLKGFIPGVEGVSKALFQPWVVTAEDFDRVTAERDALQLRLNAEDQRNDELGASLKDLISAVRSINRSPAYKVTVIGDDEPQYRQRKEWIDWVLELCDKASAGLEQPATAFGFPVVVDPALAPNEMRLAQPEPVAVVMPERLQQVLKFLDGSENLDGHWFSEPHPSGRSYWWRTELRKALEETNLFAKQQ